MFTQTLPDKYWDDYVTRYFVVCLPNPKYKDEYARPGSAQTVIAFGLGRFNRYMDDTKEDEAQQQWYWCKVEDLFTWVLAEVAKIGTTPETPTTDPELEKLRKLHVESVLLFNVFKADIENGLAKYKSGHSLLARAEPLDSPSARGGS